MTSSRRIGLAMILLSGGISLLWGFYLGQTGNGWADFRAVYYGSRCLMEHHDPYKVSDLEDVYRAEKGAPPYETKNAHQAVTLYVNVPTTFVLVAPFALLPWGPAHLLWIAFTTGVFFLAAILMWDIGARYAPGVSTVLTCILLINCESLFVAGNTAGITVGLCIVAVWCFVEERFVVAGVLCLGLSLAMKPHDGGLVWLYFLLASTAFRKRALQSLSITAVLGLTAYLWISHVAPHWMQEWRFNLWTIAQPGGINEPGPNSLTGRSSAMVIDLQAAISVFRNDPRIYNPVSYVVCGALLLAWAVRTLARSSSRLQVWVGLAAVTALTMLVTYHRPWDAKLLLLTIPACAMLWAGGRRLGWIAVLVNGAGMVLTGDTFLAILANIAQMLHVGTAGLAGKLLTVALIRPASLILLAMAIFYLWVYMRPGPAEGVSSAGHEGRVS